MVSDVNISDTEKKELFERFLTYRRRVSRMCAVQAMYLYDLRKKDGEKKTRKEMDAEIILVCQNILYFYRHMFLSKQEQDLAKKNKKIDEKYMFDTVTSAIKNLDSIDKIIAEYLNEKWTIQGLDNVVRAILRCAVAEILYDQKTQIAILTSEYTNITSHFFTGKTIGFINGIIDKIGKSKRQ